MTKADKALKVAIPKVALFFISRKISLEKNLQNSLFFPTTPKRTQDIFQSFLFYSFLSWIQCKR